LSKNEQALIAVIGWVIDPGHAWLAVSLDTEHGFPEAENFASPFSPYDITGDNFAGILYLEEDEDAPAFLKAYDLDLTVFPTFDLPEDNTLRELPRLTKGVIA
jgi:hypothetical protein